jgi:hypothetical protein
MSIPVQDTTVAHAVTYALMPLWHPNPQPLPRRWLQHWNKTLARPCSCAPPGECSECAARRRSDAWRWSHD